MPMGARGGGGSLLIALALGTGVGTARVGGTQPSLYSPP